MVILKLDNDIDNIVIDNSNNNESGNIDYEVNNFCTNTGTVWIRPLLTCIAS